MSTCMQMTSGPLVNLRRYLQRCTCACVSIDIRVYEGCAPLFLPVSVCTVLPRSLRVIEGFALRLFALAHASRDLVRRAEGAE